MYRIYHGELHVLYAKALNQCYLLMTLTCFQVVLMPLVFRMGSITIWLSVLHPLHPCWNILAICITDKEPINPTGFPAPFAPMIMHCCICTGIYISCWYDRDVYYPMFDGKQLKPFWNEMKWNCRKLWWSSYIETAAEIDWLIDSLFEDSREAWLIKLVSLKYIYNIQVSTRRAFIYICMSYNN